MLAATGRRGDETLGEFAYRSSPVRVQDVAANAVMAGCLPRDMRVVLTALEILIEPGFGTSGWGASTNSFVPWLVVNGPIRHDIELRSRGPVFGPGRRANATIGRAIRLSLMNLAGESIARRDCGTMGSPYAFTCCFGEDEEDDPDWAPLHTELGYEQRESTLLVVVTRHPRQLVHTMSHAPEHFLRAIADDLGTLGTLTEPISRPIDGHDRPATQALVVLGRQHRRNLRDAGWTKSDVRKFLHRTTRRRRDGILAYRSPQDFLVVAAGGDGPTSLSATAFRCTIAPIPRGPISNAVPPSGTDFIAADGLPGMPLVRDRLVAMTSRVGDLPSIGGLGIEQITSTALEAGCIPEHLPVVVAALHAAHDPRIGLDTFAGEEDLFPIVIVNGPIGRHLGLNSGRGAFGPGTRSNASIGRAIALALGHARRTHGLGSPYHYSSGVVAEAEELSPWPPLHTELGFDAGQSTVTLLLCAQSRQTTNIATVDAEGILRTLADDMSSPQNYDSLGGSFEHPTMFLVALCDDFRRYLGAGGWSRERVQQFLAETVGRTAGDIRSCGYRVDTQLDDADFVPLTRPNGFLVAAIGGSGGHSLTARVLRHSTEVVDDGTIHSPTSAATL
ncbi:MAG: hypothetical protein GEU74_12070 [Nitriliruptorales bacterium]|nr:hypothetical protein [Nitriliruptorales bacterium]